MGFVVRPPGFVRFFIFPRPFPEGSTPTSGVRRSLCWSARNVVVVEVNGYKIEPGANLTGVDLPCVLLGGADLTGANLSGVYLDDPIGEVNLAGAFADENTVWPGGFDSVAAGVRRSDR